MVHPSPEYLGPYRVVRLLGRGGMGTVYEAVHEKNQQRVAVKIIAEELAREPRFQRRFEAEIQTLIRLKHPN
ncbi:MAG: protein kinase domain-containing protein, partial [Planctomycetota bacterium]